jgi:threonylcarbamoyladenosine tRNA methylthiotransferase MtaB
MGVEIITFGCRLNAAESQRIATLARAAALEDTVIVNTCAVTAEAERQARQAIRRARRERPHARIVVTGCGVQAAPERFDLPEADRLVGNADKLDGQTWRALDHAPRIAVRPIARDDVPPPVAAAFLDHTRAFVEVQQGCDHRCTFCVIPLGRGPSRSLDAEAVVAQIRQALAQGAREAVLTGVDLTAWGDDLGHRPRLGALVRRILADLPALARLRLSSLDPAEIDDELLRCVAGEARLMPHIHLSLQAGDDLILKRMKRRHSTAQAIEMAARLRAARPGIALGADVIAGFPTEDDHAFERTSAHVEALAPAHLHVFPFSARPGTPAARMPQAPGPAIKARAARLRAIGAAARARFAASLLGRSVQVLVERDGMTGYCEQFLKVRLDCARAPGAIVAARLTGDDGRMLTGVAA